MPGNKIAALLLPALLLCSCARPAADESRRILRDDLMGTVMSITAYGEAAAIEAAYDRIGEVHRLCDVNAPDSQVSQVNAAAGADPLAVDDVIADLIDLSWSAARLSQSAFHCTMGELIALWGIDTEHPTVPEPAAIAAALGRIDAAEITRWRDTVLLTVPGVRLHFGGVAKGYACDEAVRVLREQGVSSAILDLGGNVYALGQKPDSTDWKIGMRSPLGDSAVIATMHLRDRAAVTSGSYERWFEHEGKRYHHILDPATGYPAESGLLAVTILYPEAAMADAMSTACFVLGYEEGAALVAGVDGMAAIFITEDRLVYTVGDVGDFTLEDDRFTPMGAAA